MASLGRRTRVSVSAVIAGLVASVSLACSGSQPEPDVVVFQWVYAVASQDGTTVGRLTCRANQAEVQNQRLLTMALDVPPSTTFGAGGGGPFLTGGGGAGTSYDVSELRYETAFADNRTARVKVTGPLRLVSGVASQVLTMNSTVALTREQDQWRVCDRPNP